MTQNITVEGGSDLDRVLQAFRNPKWNWRTLGGIARESKLSPDKILKLVQAHPDLFRKSSVAPSGIPLYGLRRHSILLETTPDQ